MTSPGGARPIREQKGAGAPLAWLVVALAGSPFGCVEYRQSQLERERASLEQEFAERVGFRAPESTALAAAATMGFACAVGPGRTGRAATCDRWRDTGPWIPFSGDLRWTITMKFENGQLASFRVYEFHDSAI